MPNASPHQSVLKLTRRQTYLGKLIFMNRPQDQNGRDAAQVNDDLMGDMFWGLFSVNDIPEADQIPPEREANSQILRWLRSTPAWNDLRLTTSGSLALSSLAVELVYADLIKPQNQDQPQPQSAAGRAIMNQAWQEAAEASAELTEQRANQIQSAQNASGNRSAQMARAYADQARQKALEASQAVKEALEDLRQQSAPAHTEKKIGDQMQEVREAMISWGMEPGNPTYNAEALKKIIQIARALMENDLIRQLTAALGRAKGIAMSYRSKIVVNRGVVVDGGYTQDPMRLAPQQLASILPVAPHVLRAIKVAEFGSRGLEGMIEGHDGRREGALIIAVDSSGSMSGERMVRANGAAVGLCLAARDTGQEYTAYKFSEVIVGNRIDTQSAPEEIIAWAAFDSGGGTSFDEAILNAIKIMENSGPAAFYSDFVIITDGECRMNPETIRSWKKAKREYGQRMVALIIGTSPQELKNIADYVIVADDAMSVDQMTDSIAAFLASNPEDREVETIVETDTL